MADSRAPFRDDHAAALARADALAAELARVAAERDGLAARLAGHATSPPSDLGAAVLAQERAEARKRARSDAKVRRKAEAATQLAARAAALPPRVAVKYEGEAVQVTIGRARASVVVCESMEWVLLVGLLPLYAAAITGTVWLGRSPSLGMACAVATLAITYLLYRGYRRFANPIRQLELSADGFFALRVNGRPEMLGRTASFTITISPPDLHGSCNVWFRSGDRQIDLRTLGPQDVERLRTELTGHVKIV